jgi:hypothetical protein
LFIEVLAHEEKRNDYRDHEANEVIHNPIFSYVMMEGTSVTENCAKIDKE